VVDASKTPSQVHNRIVQIISERNLGQIVPLEDGGRTIGRPGPLPR